MEMLPIAEMTSKLTVLVLFGNICETSVGCSNVMAIKDNFIFGCFDGLSRLLGILNCWKCLFSVVLDIM